MASKPSGRADCGVLSNSVMCWERYGQAAAIHMISVTPIAIGTHSGIRRVASVSAKIASPSRIGVSWCETTIAIQQKPAMMSAGRPGVTGASARTRA